MIPPSELIPVDDRVVRLVALPWRPYVRALAAFLDRHGGWRRRPWDLLARAFVETVDGVTIIRFRGGAWRDERLAAHELGHVLGLHHPEEWSSFRGAVRLILDPDVRTVMHPSGLWRKRDPHMLVARWRALRPPTWRMREHRP